jgi:two-component system, LuxR family, sensor kinase FixL
MTMANLPHITRCGLPGVDCVPFGMHACLFYSDPDQLVAALVPYVVAGLRAHERCLWVIAPPLRAREVVQALRTAWDGVDDAIQAGALRILDSAQLRGIDVVQLWLEEEERALAEGCNGLRIAGDTSFLTPGDWPAFMAYERALTARCNERRIVALCGYALAQCNDQQMSEVMHAHHCAFERPDADWRVVAVPRLLNGFEISRDLIETVGNFHGDSHDQSLSVLGKRRVRPRHGADDVHRP